MRVFLVVEKSEGGAAMMPLALFGSSSFIGLTLLTFFVYGALGALLVLLPYVLIEAAGYSAAQAGAALVPFAIVLALASPAMGGVAGRIGARVPLSIGPLVIACGFLLALRIGSQAEYWTTVFPAILIIAFGMSGAAAPLTTAILGSVDSRHTGSAPQQRRRACWGYGGDGTPRGRLGRRRSCARQRISCRRNCLRACICRGFGECIFPHRQQCTAEIGAFLKGHIVGRCGRTGSIALATAMADLALT
jgi:hypothetical protein